MIVGLFLDIGVNCADYRWEATGPTAEDIRAATKVDNLAAKGSLEDKFISAVKNGDLKSVETFIAAGADLEARDNENMTPLMISAEKGYSDIARIIIDAGADISAKDRFTCTALSKAEYNNHVEIVKMLIAKGAATDKNFKDILAGAIFKGNIEMVKALLVDIDEIKYDDLEAVYAVVDYRNRELVRIIREALKKKAQ